VDSSGGDQSTQGSEVGLPNVEVQLTDSMGHVVTTTTSITGYYLFANLPLGQYTVTVNTATLPVTVTTDVTYDPDGGSENESANRRDHRDDQQRVEAGQPVPDQGESIHPDLLPRFGRR
jgi:serine-aspartate repeat-containing protein C/D/E